MKKLLALILSLTMVLCLAACGGGDDKSGEVDMSKYPADINEWTAQNFNDYFTEAGVYTNEDWVNFQDHAQYYSGTAIDEAGGYMDDAGMINIAVFIVDPDSIEADGEALLNYVKENKCLTEDFSAMPIDHMVGNALFWYSYTSDEEVYNAFEEAYNNLVEALGVTPEF